MWIHLLPLGLIDGAGGGSPEPPYIPPAQSGSGGGGSGRGLRELLDKAFRKEPKAKEKLLDTIREVPLAKRPDILIEALPEDPSIPALREKRAILAQLLVKLREIEEEEEIIVHLLLT